MFGQGLRKIIAREEFGRVSVIFGGIAAYNLFQMNGKFIGVE
jgi:hypothetical protein